MPRIGPPHYNPQGLTQDASASRMTGEGIFNKQKTRTAQVGTGLPTHKIRKKCAFPTHGPRVPRGPGGVQGWSELDFFLVRTFGGFGGGPLGTLRVPWEPSGPRGDPGGQRCSLWTPRAQSTGSCAIPQRQRRLFCQAAITAEPRSEQQQKTQQIVSALAPELSGIVHVAVTFQVPDSLLQLSKPSLSTSFKNLGIILASTSACTLQATRVGIGNRTLTKKAAIRR